MDKSLGKEAAMTMAAGTVIPAFPPTTPTHTHVLIEPGEWTQLEVVADDSGVKEFPLIVTALRQNCNLPVSLSDHPEFGAEALAKFNRLLEEELPIRLVAPVGMEGCICFQRTSVLPKQTPPFRCHA